jgi:hypothetical protein
MTDAIENPIETAARYQTTLRAIASCTLTGVAYGDWVQSVVEDALEGRWPECWNCGTAVHEGPCVEDEPDEALPGEAVSRCRYGHTLQQHLDAGGCPAFKHQRNNHEGETHTMEEVIERSDEQMKPADTSGPAPTKEEAGDGLRAEIKAWAEAVAAQPHSLGGIIMRARNTDSGEMIALAALGTKRSQLKMLIKLFEQLDERTVATAIQFFRASPLERIVFEALLDVSAEIVSEGHGVSGESMRKAVSESMQEQPTAEVKSDA